MNIAAVTASTARCPRCGYDQRGVMATWTESCPLESVCTECGVALTWAEILHPEKYEPRWCVEFAPKRRRLPIACIRTLFASLRFRWFWKRLRMSFPVRSARLVVYACFLLMLVFLLTHAAMQTYLAVRMRYQIGQQWADYAKSVPVELAAAQQTLAAVQSGQFVPSSSIDKAELVTRLQFEIVGLQAAVASPPVVNHSYAAAIAEAVFLPFANFSFGEIRCAGRRIASYPDPLGLTYSVWGYTGVHHEATRARHSKAVALAWALSFLLPSCFILLPISRKRAKVKWIHLFRITIYGMVIPTLVTILMTACWIGTLISSNGLLVDASRWIGFMAWFLIPTWWTVAIRHHLRMPHAGSIAFVLTLLIALMTSPWLLDIVPQWLERAILAW